MPRPTVVRFVNSLEKADLHYLGSSTSQKLDWHDFDI